MLYRIHRYYRWQGRSIAWAPPNTRNRCPGRHRISIECPYIGAMDDNIERYAYRPDRDMMIALKRSLLSISPTTPIYYSFLGAMNLRKYACHLHTDICCMKPYKNEGNKNKRANKYINQLQECAKFPHASLLRIYIMRYDLAIYSCPISWQRYWWYAM